MYIFIYLQWETTSLSHSTPNVKSLYYIAHTTQFCCRHACSLFISHYRLYCCLYYFFFMFSKIQLIYYTFIVLCFVVLRFLNIKSWLHTTYFKLFNALYYKIMIYIYKYCHLVSPLYRNNMGKSRPIDFVVSCISGFRNICNFPNLFCSW